MTSLERCDSMNVEENNNSKMKKKPVDHDDVTHARPKEEPNVVVQEPSSSMQHHDDSFQIMLQESTRKRTRPFGVTVIVTIMALGVFVMFYYLILLQGASSIEENTKMNFFWGLIALGTIFLSLAIGLWLGITVFRYLFIGLNLLFIIYAFFAFLLSGNTAGIIFVLPSATLTGYMLLPHVKQYFTRAPSLSLQPIKKNEAD